MKKLFYSAMALSLTTVPGFASPGLAPGDEWSTLDQEIEALSASLAADNGNGPDVSGFLITDYRSSSDIMFDDGDLGGFSLREARVAVTGTNGDYYYKVQYNFADSTLKDAYARFPIGGSVHGQMGNQKPVVLRSALLSASRLFFADRTVNGSAWASRDVGLMLSGDFDVVGWAVQAQNGTDGIADDLLLTGRLTFDFLGEGIHNHGGARHDDSGSPGATAAVSFWDDGSVDDGDGFAGEVHLANNVYSFGGEVVAIGDNSLALDRYGAGMGGDITPFAVYGTYMFSPAAWEAGLRYQDFDDDENDTTSIEVAINRYLNGHDLKWTLFYETLDADEEEAEVDLLGLQLVLAF